MIGYCPAVYLVCYFLLPHSCNYRKNQFTSELAVLCHHGWYAGLIRKGTGVSLRDVDHDLIT